MAKNSDRKWMNLTDSERERISAPLKLWGEMIAELDRQERRSQFGFKIKHTDGD
ncbi:hypothetical protein ACTXK0_01000 [Corynebacterium variabile]|uniref:hypothetical protein n=1 Tax=Corynebacterium variabile TaxID=1727 RepID=UPI003FD0E5A9